MTLIDNLYTGFSVALTFQNIVYALVGCLVGTLVGVLPGIGALATISMLLPITYSISPVSALVMLSGIYYGAQYGGSTTAILINLPGEITSVPTVIDGHKMAKSGRAGPALSAAAIGSFVAGSIGTVLIAAFAPYLASLAFAFGPAEYFALMVLGLVGALILSSGSMINSIGVIIIGLILGLVGTDINTGQIRFGLGIPELSDGIGFIAVAMGLYGYAEIINNLQTVNYNNTSVGKISKLYPTKDDFKNMFPAIFRGTSIGSVLGILPGAGSLLASFAAYTVEKKVKDTSKEPAIGHGNIRGVAGPESANNAAAQTSFIPMLTLGVPSNVVMVLLLGAMISHNIQPGPQIISSNPELFWGLIASMWIGNLMLLVLNLPLVGMWVKMLKIPYRLLYPVIILFCAIGVYTSTNNVFDIWVVTFFGFVGYILTKLECDPTPMLLGFILGPIMEENLRRSLLVSGGDWTVLITRPISASLLLVSVSLILMVILVPSFNHLRNRLKED